jgi:mTERF domain-containing protein
VPKIDYLQSLGFTNEEEIRALIRFPAIFNYSVEKNLQPKYAYLVEDMGRGLDDLKAFPQYFGYSLESRIQPRHQFLKEQNLVLSLPNILRPSDEEFYARVRNRKVATSPVIRKSGHLCESMTS